MERLCSLRTMSGGRSFVVVVVAAVEVVVAQSLHAQARSFQNLGKSGGCSENADEIESSELEQGECAAQESCGLVDLVVANDEVEVPY